VLRYLVERGVAPARLEAKGMGETRPLIAQRTKSAREANRRVEFHIISQDKAACAQGSTSDAAANRPAPP
ncbi:MAG: OmpA family, partial [Pseudomonadota bacterium]